MRTASPHAELRPADKPLEYFDNQSIDYLANDSFFLVIREKRRNHAWRQHVVNKLEETWEWSKSVTNLYTHKAKETFDKKLKLTNICHWQVLS